MSIQQAPQVKSLNPPRRVLMGPGPSDVSDRVREAMAKPLVGHLDPEFLSIMDDNQSMLRYVFQTNNELTIPISATGSAGMEACIVNLVQEGDKILIGINGVFGKRMADVAERAGAEVVTIEKPWGEVFTFEEIKSAWQTHKPKFLGLVHGETSTGALQPLEGIGELVHGDDGFLIVDAVTSLAGVPVMVDEWGIDAVYSGSQKCLSCPPGLAPVSFSQRAADVLSSRSTKVQSWYLDLSMVMGYWGGERAYHHTAPVTMNYGLHAALQQICEEGLEKRWQRHENLHRCLAVGLEGLGLQFMADKAHRLPQLNAVAIPNGVNDTSVRKRLLQDFNIEIGGGLGAFKGKVWRIGLMGDACGKNQVLTLLGALEYCLKGEGEKVGEGAGVGPASDMMLELGI